MPFERILMSRTFNSTFLAALMASPLCALADGGQPVTGEGAFNTEFLFNPAGAADLDVFLKSSEVLPGDYRVDILVNRELVGRRTVGFAVDPQSGRVRPCLTIDILEAMGVDLDKLPANPSFDRHTPAACLDLPGLIEKSSLVFDVNRLQLSASVPQAAMRRQIRGYVDPHLWDDGITAGFVNYDVSIRSSRNLHSAQNQFYHLGMRSGLNLGAWRLRNDSTLRYDRYDSDHFSSNRTFAQRDVTAWKSQFTLGETFTDGQTFDSVRFRGLQLATDEGMLPDSQRGYAPVVRGTAYGNATVEIRQNGYLLQSVQVAPGPFEITDGFSSGSNGDLHITVIEADGSQHVSIQAFAALPQMVREGMFRYSLEAGQYSDQRRDARQPLLAVATLAYGVGSNTTLFGGLQAAPGFKSGNLGASWNLPWGAVSADLTQSQSLALAQRNTGHSTGLRYSRTFADVGTTFALASYRYSTPGYRTLDEHVKDFSRNSHSLTRGKARSRFNMTLDQALGDRKGRLYLSVDYQNYFNFNQASQQYQLGYSSAWKQLNYNLRLAHTRQQGVRLAHNNELSLSVSMPWGAGARPSRLHVTAAHKGAQGSAGQVRLSGNIPGQEDALYTVETGMEQWRGGATSLHASTTTALARLNAGYSQGRGYQSLNIGAAGSLVAHAGGINLGLPVGESFALLEVQGVPAARLASDRNVAIGRNGFAVLPGTHPYRSNWVRLDTRELGAHIEIDNPTRQLIPRRGSITKATFNASQGRRVQFALSDAHGSPLPFGGLVSGFASQPSVIVDPGGRALLLVPEGSQSLVVHSGQQRLLCRYQLPALSEGLSYEQVPASCLPSDATADHPDEV